jgi:hypothetical protein
VGRAAGLKIRRDLARNLARNSGYRQSSSRTTTYRRTRYRETYRSRPPHAVRVVERTPVTPSRPASARLDEPAPVDAADASSPRPDTADAMPDQPGSGPASPEAGKASEADNAPSAAQANPAGASGAPTEDESTQDLAPETSPNGREESEEASLVIPRGAMPAPLRGSLESLERQNTKLDSEGLERIENEDDLAARIAHGLLVPVPLSSGLTVNEALPATHRYCRPWTAHFLADLARAHEAAFHRPLEVSSAVRTVEYQQHLMRVNGNAAPAEGDIVSPHLTGATIDIAKHGLSRQEVGWMRNRLLSLEAQGKIDVEEEFRQSCFHITVYRTYAPVRPAPKPSQATEPEAAPETVGDSSNTGL